MGKPFDARGGGIVFLNANCSENCLIACPKHVSAMRD